MHLYPPLKRPTKSSDNKDSQKGMGCCTFRALFIVKSKSMNININRINRVLTAANAGMPDADEVYNSLKARFATQGGGGNTPAPGNG